MASPRASTYWTTPGPQACCSHSASSRSGRQPRSAPRGLIGDRARRAAHLFALGVPLYVLLVSAGPESEFRFRVPVVPALTLYAAAGAVYVARVVRRRWQRDRTSTPIGDDGAEGAPAA